MTKYAIAGGLVEVTAKEYRDFNIKKILDALENLEFMSELDKIDVLDGAFEEVDEYLQLVKDSVVSAKETRAEYEDKDDYERLTGHEMGVCSGGI